jgi:DNA primase
VFICEGEKDADNVAALGLVATTNPGGAKVWQPELAPWFKDKQLVYVLEDNDEAGREHTRTIIAALHRVVPTILTVAFSELPEKSDVSDWLEAGGNKKLLLARAAEAHKRSSARRNYTLVDLHTLQLEATDWLWEGHLICGELELFAGRPGVGKCQVQCQMIACVTTGRNWPDG